MLPGRIPARLRFRAHPAPLAIGPAITPFQHEGLQRRLAGNALLHDAVHVVRMDDFPPVERQPFVVGNAQKFQIGLVGEGAGAVDLGHPHRHRRAVGDQAKPLFALAQGLPGQRKLGDVDVRADQPQRPAVGIAFNPGFGGDPAELSVIRPDDAVLIGKLLAGTFHRIEELPHGSFAIFRMQPGDPVLVGVIGVRRQAVDGAIFRGSALVSKTVPQVDRDRSDLGDLPETGSARIPATGWFRLPDQVRFRQCLPCSLPLDLPGTVR